MRTLYILLTWSLVCHASFWMSNGTQGWSGLAYQNWYNGHWFEVSFGYASLPYQQSPSLENYTLKSLADPDIEGNALFVLVDVDFPTIADLGSFCAMNPAYIVIGGYPPMKDCSKSQDVFDKSHHQP